jgi:hypothetical protein
MQAAEAFQLENQSKQKADKGQAANL